METQPGKTEEKEFIVKAAIQFPDGEIFTGRAHLEIFEKFFEKFLDAPCEKKEGFVTNKGRFVSREEAEEVALNAKQIEKKSKNGRLQSPDLNLE